MIGTLLSIFPIFLRHFKEDRGSTIDTKLNLNGSLTPKFCPPFSLGLINMPLIGAFSVSSNICFLGPLICLRRITFFFIISFFTWLTQGLKMS